MVSKKIDALLKEEFRKDWEDNSELRNEYSDNFDKYYNFMTAFPNRNHDFLKELYKIWVNDSELRDEFLSEFSTYIYYKEAEKNDLIQYPDLERKINALDNPSNRDLPIVEKYITKARNRKAGKGKRGREGRVKITIRRFLSEPEINNFETLINAMDDEETVNKVCYDPDDPAPMRIIDVYREKQKVTYLTESGEEKCITFSGIQTSLTEINKSNKILF